MTGSDPGRRPSTLTSLLLINLGLALLFIWALTEQTTLRLEIVDGICTAVLDGRTNSAPCPGLAGGRIGLYTAVGDDLESLARDPWRLIAPTSSWRSLSVARPDSSKSIQLLRTGRPALDPTNRDAWRTTAGELRPAAEEAVILWSNPLPGDFHLAATLRRPADEAGVLLLQRDGAEGWLFLYDSDARLGTWWRWRQGQPAEPLLGAPYQKSLAAQVQSLVRRVLLGHQAGLLLLLASWLLAMILARTAGRLRRRRGYSPDAAAGSARSSNGQARLLTRLALVVLILLVFAATLFISGDLLDGLPHVQDSITYLFQGQTLARGRLTAPAPPFPEAFKQEFLLVNDGQWFGKYPPGYPLLLALGERTTGLPRLVNPLLATLTLALLFTLARAWYGRRVGLLAALLAAVSPFFLIMSGTFMAHPAELFWLTLFMVAWTRVIRRDDAANKVGSAHDRAGRKWLPWLIVAGAALGMALLTRQLTAVVVAGAFILVSAISQPGHVPWRVRTSRLLALAIAFAPFALLLLAYQWSVTGDPLKDPRLLFWPYDHLGFGQDIGQGQNVVTFETIQGEEILVWQHDPLQPPRGHTPARGVFNLERNWRHLSAHTFGWLPLFTLAFAWIVFAAGRARRADWLFLSTAATLMVVYVFYWADGVVFGPRYLYAALPALLLLVARGVQVTADWIGGVTGRWAVGLIVAAFVAGGLLVYLPTALDSLRNYNFVGRPELAAVEAAIDEQALIFVAQDNGDWWEYGNYFIGNNPWLDSRIIYARDQGPAGNAQLQAHYPDRAPYLLQNGRLMKLESGKSSDSTQS